MLPENTRKDEFFTRVSIWLSMKFLSDFVVFMNEMASRIDRKIDLRMV